MPGAFLYFGLFECEQKRKQKMKENQERINQMLEFADERPLSGGKSCERFLDKGQGDLWRFRVSKAIYLPFGFLIMIPLWIAFASGSWFAMIIPAVALLILSIASKSFLSTPTFDFSNNCYYCDSRKPKYGDVTTLKHYLPLSKITAIQLLFKTVRGSKGSVRQGYELNLVTDDVKRVFVTDSSNYARLRKAAEELAARLNVPLKEYSRNKIASKPVPRWCGFIFLFFFSGMGMIGLYQNVLQPLQRNLQAQKWSSQPAVVTKSIVETQRRHSKSSSYTVYKAVISYRYFYKGKEYTSDLYSMFNDFKRSGSTARQLVRNYPPGKQIRCFVNPDVPFQAVIDKKIPAAGLCLEAGGYMIFICAGIGVFLLLWSQRKR